MHELGHNLGLVHGGGFLGEAESFPAYKPNYLSVMKLQLSVRRHRSRRGGGRQRAQGVHVGHGLSGRCALQPSGALPPARLLDAGAADGTATPGLLDENGKLDEAAGLGSGTSDTFFFTDAACNFQEAATNGPVDWDGDGTSGDNAAATADLDPTDHFNLSCGADTTEVFRGQVDWGPTGAPLFSYPFQCTSHAGD
jgi:hypothetical protein